MVMRGAFTPPPRMDAPMTKIPLRSWRRREEGDIPRGSDDREPDVKGYAEKAP